MRFFKRPAWQCCLVLILALTSCRSDTVDVTGPEFMKAFEERKPDEKFLFREGSSGFLYLDCYRMRKTESVFKKIGTLRTATKNLTADQTLLLKQKAVEGEWTPRPPLPVPERKDVPPQVRATIEQLYEKYKRQADVSSPLPFVCATNLSYESDYITVLTTGSNPGKLWHFKYNWHVNFFWLPRKPGVFTTFEISQDGKILKEKP